LNPIRKAQQVAFKAKKLLSRNFIAQKSHPRGKNSVTHFTPSAINSYFFLSAAHTCWLHVSRVHFLGGVGLNPLYFIIISILSATGGFRGKRRIASDQATRGLCFSDYLGRIC